MDRDTARQEIRRNWRSIILNYTSTARKKVGGKETYICPFCGHGKNGDGITDNPKSKDGNGIKCFGACDFSGDIIEFIQRATGADYNTALHAAAADLGITIDPYRQSLQGAAANFTAADAQKRVQGDVRGADDKKTAGETKSPQQDVQQPTAASIADYTAYYEQCSKNLSDPAAASYLQARGISPATAAAYRLGYDAAWISPTVVRNQQAKGSNWRPDPTARIILPVSRNHYIARAISQDVKDFAKMNETGGGGTGIFNSGAVYGKKEAVFVTEGIFDALSIIECGGAAVALNSTSNADLFIKQLEQRQTGATLVLCLDNDEPGKKAAAVLKQGLRRLNISYTTADICGSYKDPNEALTGNRAAFEKALQDAEVNVLHGVKVSVLPDPKVSVLPDDKVSASHGVNALLDNKVSATHDISASLDDKVSASHDVAKEAGGADQLPGLLTYSDAVNIFERADDRHLELRSFPAFSAMAKIKVHDSVVLAADTGAGKSSLAINFLNDLNGEYPCIYINLEMDIITVLRRLTAIHSGMELDRIEGYKRDEKTAEAVNISLQAITSRKPLQVIQGVYMLQEIEDIIKKSIRGRDEPTIVIIDHSLLVDTQKHTGSRYDRFTEVSEGLRRVALSNNIVLFVLLQQNRSGKANENERPRNSSLKESGSWENDATQICFLWYDPEDRKKKLLLTKNRSGGNGDFVLNYWKKTQTYTEATGSTVVAQTTGGTPRRQTRREQQSQRLISAYEIAYINTQGRVTIRAIAEAADVTTNTVKTWLKEYGGFIVDGKPIDPAGVDAVVEQQEFIKLTPADHSPFDDPESAKPAAGNGQTVTARF